MRRDVPGIAALEDKREDLKSMSERLEEVVFMEEDATKLAKDIERLSRKYPEDKFVAEAAREAVRGLERFHYGVIDVLSRALDALDEADDVCLSGIEDLENVG